MVMTNSEIAGIFEQIAEILEIKGENHFKVRAYLNAAAAVNRSGENLSDTVKSGKPIDIPGIGAELSLKIKELVNTGRLAYYDELVESVPAGLLELMKLRGLGPKKANILYENLHIKNIDELYGALKSGGLNKIYGFGQKSIENLKKSVEEYKTFKKRFLYADAFAQASLFEAYLKNTAQKLISGFEIAGSLRRKMETVGDIDMVASVKDENLKPFSERFLDYDGILRVESFGETKISVVLKSGIHLDLRIVPPEDFVYALHHFTGSKLHNEELRSREKKLGYKINEYGIFKNKNYSARKEDEEENMPDVHDSRILVNDETEFYGVFGMQFIPPELREGTGEIESALNRAIPRLVEEKDLKGVFHVHTTYTDGKNSLEEMVEACVRRGYKYAGISDHSVSARYAKGLSVSELESQLDYIDRLNKKFEGKIRIFKGIESDILPDGSLDYDEKTLMKLDFVIASVHSNFNMPENVMTERIINAVKNPYTSMIGHLTGRLLLERNGYGVDVSRVLDCASKYKTVIELNANPKRLDLDWRHIKEAVSKGVMISINPDAHNASSIYFVNYGINIARKGWAVKGDIFNTRNASEVSGILENMRVLKKKLN